MTFICYKNCTTCRRAKKWLEEKKVAYQYREITEDNPTVEELKVWHEKSGLPLRRFFNTSGNIYRELNLKDKLPNLSQEEQYQLLATDGMLVRRPILLASDTVLVGFKEEEWENALL